MIRFHGPRRAAKGSTRRRVPGEMNKTEAAFEAEFLAPRNADGELIWHGYEAMTFKLAKDLRYTPDFMAQAWDGQLFAYEVKGSKKNKETGEKSALVEDASLIKIKAAAQLFPVVFRMAWKGKEGWEWREF